MKNHCSQIDEYLDGSLSCKHAIEFENHLPSCPDCRLEVSIAATMDEKIRDAWQDVRAPEQFELAFQSSGKINKSWLSKPKVITATILAIAAAVVVGVSLAMLLMTQSGREDGVASNTTSPEEMKTTTPVSRPTVVFVQQGGADDALLIPVPQTHPHFTIVKAYRPLIFNPHIESFENEQTN